jgi:hypothetical protein
MHGPRRLSWSWRGLLFAHRKALALFLAQIELRHGLSQGRLRVPRLKAARIKGRPPLRIVEKEAED